MDKERWTISGSHGFLGSNLTRKVEGFGAVVTPMDREPDRFLDTDVFVDLAAFGNLHHQKGVYDIFNANTFRVFELLDQNQLVNYKAFIVTSTSAVTLPVRTTYTMSKKAMEDIATTWALIYRKPIAIVRPYSITGVGEQPEHLIPKLIESCMQGIPMDFVPEPVHDFLDVEDFTDAIITISQNAKNYPGRIFPIGSGIQYSNAQVLEIVEKVTGKKANINIVKSMRNYDTTEWRADRTLMYSLGWEPKKILEQSVKEMVNAYR